VHGWEGGGWRDIQPIVLTSEGSPLGSILCMDLHCTFESNKKKKRSNKRERKQQREKRMIQSYKCGKVPTRPDRFTLSDIPYI